MKDRKEYMRQWRKNNPDKVRQHNRTYCDNNREKINAASLAYYHANSEHCNARSRQYAKDNHAPNTPNTCLLYTSPSPRDS